ncbi:SDR family oxidoreductase [Enterococcus sp. LJL120]
MSKVIVVTGASSGIGEATAKMLAKAGNQLVLAARREDKLKEIVAVIREAGGEAVYILADVSKFAENQKISQLAIDEFGRIDVWINNAGLMPLSEFAKGKVDEWDCMVDVNLKGTLYGIDAALPQMRAQKSGQFINIGSISSHQSGPAAGVYAATKFGVWAASEALRQEEAMAQSNIRVTVIAPGAIDTELPNHVTDRENAEGMAGFYSSTAIPADQVARTVQFAIDTPENTSINEIVLRPTAQVL